MIQHHAALWCADCVASAETQHQKALVSHAGGGSARQVWPLCGMCNYAALVASIGRHRRLLHASGLDSYALQHGFVALPYSGTAVLPYHFLGCKPGAHAVGVVLCTTQAAFCPCLYLHMRFELMR